MINNGFFSGPFRIEARAYFAVFPFIDFIEVILKSFIRHLTVAVIKFINQMTVAGNNGSNVVFGFHTTFDLKRRNSGFHQFFDLTAGHHILGTDCKHIFIGTESGVLFHQMILPTTGLGTATAVCITKRHTITQSAPAGNIYAHTTMDKSFCFDRTRCGDGTNLFHGTFASQYHTIYMVFFNHKSGSQRIGNRHLGTAVDFQLWSNTLGKSHDGNTGSDNGGDTGFFQILQILCKTFKVFIVRNNIYGYVDVCTMLSGIGTYFTDVFHGEIGCVATKGKRHTSQIYSIRAIVDCYLCTGQISRRSQKLRFC